MLFRKARIHLDFPANNGVSEAPVIVAQNAVFHPFDLNERIAFLVFAAQTVIPAVFAAVSDDSINHGRLGGVGDGGIIVNRKAFFQHIQHVNTPPSIIDFSISLFHIFVNSGIVSEIGNGYNNLRQYSTQKGGIVFAAYRNLTDTVRAAGSQWV